MQGTSEEKFRNELNANIKLSNLYKVWPTLMSRKLLTLIQGQFLIKVCSTFKELLFTRILDLGLCVLRVSSFFCWLVRVCVVGRCFRL